MNTSLIAASPATSINSAKTTNRGRRGWAVAAVGAMILGTLIGGTGIASAAPGVGSTPSTTTATATITSTIALTLVTPTVHIAAVPGQTSAADAPVTMNVLTNNLLGYNVTVQATAATMVPESASAPVNPDSILIAALQVRQTGGGAFSPMLSTGPVTVHSQATRSASGGDTLSNDYQLIAPFVNEDTYTADLTYIATTL